MLSWKVFGNIFGRRFCVLGKCCNGWSLERNVDKVKHFSILWYLKFPKTLEMLLVKEIELLANLCFVLLKAPWESLESNLFKNSKPRQKFSHQIHLISCSTNKIDSTWRHLQTLPSTRLCIYVFFIYGDGSKSSEQRRIII